jgi:hypothetical protein
LWATSRILYAALTLVLPLLLGAQRTAAVFDYPYAHGDLLHVWDHHDTRHYLAIALGGYSIPYLTCFFPLYPWLTGFLHATLFAWLPASGMLAALAVSNGATLAGCVGLGVLADDLFGRAAVRSSIHPGAAGVADVRLSRRAVGG